MTIEQLASVTRLNIKFIEALEAGRRDLLPGQVYLKPFVKTCAEALDLDLKELYKIIEGESPKNDKESQTSPEKEKKRSGPDYKLLVVLIIAAIIVAVIYITVKTRDKIPPKTEITEIIPAGATKIRKEINWSRPWERPAFYKSGILKQNLMLLVADSVGVFILSGNDTLFNGTLTDGEKRVFTSKNGFVLNLTRNDCVTGFINGQKDMIIGSSGGKLENYSIGKQGNR